MPPRCNSWTPVSRAQWLEFKTLLPGYILSSQGDRMLMANSVEGRFPFLDRSVIDLANSIPTSHKLLALDEKHLLKKMFADLVPESILRRPKQPYRAPDASNFFSGAMPEWLPELVSVKAIEEAGVFSSAAVSAFFKKCTSVQGRGMSNTDNMRAIAILSTQLAHRYFISENGSGPQARRAPVPVHAMEMIVV